jgi:hypothetical protein
VTIGELECSGLRCAYLGTVWLTGDAPIGLGWIIEPIIQKLFRKPRINTLEFHAPRTGFEIHSLGIEKPVIIGNMKGFLRANAWRVTATSVLLLVPCFWHRRIEASDLASHTYNAWLAQLIARGQAPSLYVVPQATNVMFDVALARLGGLIGLGAAERVVVPACILIFFWGAYALASAVTGRPPWFLAPALAMVAYGWTFSMGFMNYYLSTGLAFFGTAIFLRARGWDRMLALVVAVGVFLAHVIGFALMIGMVAYFELSNRLRGWLRWCLPVTALLVIAGVSLYVARHYQAVGWVTSVFYIFNGSDQLAVYGTRYRILSFVALAFGLACFLHGVIRAPGKADLRSALRTPLELWVVLLFFAAVFPEVIFFPPAEQPLALIVSRLTCVTAVVGMCALGCLPAKRWYFAGLAACAGVFFAFLYQDTGRINRMEENAERLVSGLPPGHRVMQSIWLPDSQIQFMGHIVDRACIGRCVAYSNYEPSTGQFRIRVRPGSPLVTSSAMESETMEEGDYVVQPKDLPVAQVYQCDPMDFTQLCIRELTAGEKNGRLGYAPPKDLR